MQVACNRVTIRVMTRNRTSRYVTIGDTKLRNALLERKPSAWFTADEACLYLGCARGALRARICRGSIKPDGRGARREPMFRRATLDAHLRRAAA